MLKFGIKTSQGGYSYNELSEVWKKTEELGFDSAFLYDHLSAVGNPKDNCLEAYSTLGALARDTSKLRIGVMATSVNYRNPGLLAKITSTVDNISDGRLILGLGAGWNETEMKSFGYPVFSPNERINQLIETIRIVRKMWEEEQATYKGSIYSVDSAMNFPKPVQKSPPIWIGIMKGTRVLPRVAIRDADGFNTIAPPDLCERMIETAEQERTELGGDRKSYTYSLQISVLVGSDAELQRIADAEAPRRSMTRSSYFETLANQGWLVGSPESVAQQLKKYADIGIDYMLIAVGSDRLGWPLEVVRDKLLEML